MSKHNRTNEQIRKIKRVLDHSKTGKIEGIRFNSHYPYNIELLTDGEKDHVITFLNGVVVNKLVQNVNTDALEEACSRACEIIVNGDKHAQDRMYRPYRFDSEDGFKNRLLEFARYAAHFAPSVALLIEMQLNF